MGKNTIIFCGPASSGKTTAAQEIAKRFGLKFYDGGDILKLLAKDMGYDPSGKDWWDTPQGMEFFGMRKKDPSFDHKVDAKFIEILDGGNCAVTSWTMPWLYKGDAVRVWISASPEERAKRMMNRDNIDFDRAHDVVKTRDNINKEHYKKLYGIEFGNDFKPFDIVLDTTRLTKEEVAVKLAEELKMLLNRIPKFSQP